MTITNLFSTKWMQIKNKDKDACKACQEKHNRIIEVVNALQMLTANALFHVYGLEQIAALSEYHHQSLVECLTDLKHMDEDYYAAMTHITIVSADGTRREIA